MKKYVFTFVMTLLLTQVFSQDTLKSNLTQKQEKKHLNELGLDMTPFIKYYLDFSDNNTFNYQPTYLLTYRRYFKKSNFRSAIGGNYLYEENPSPFSYDSLNTIYTNKKSSFVLRVGYEFFQDLTKRWQVYYGADLITNYSFERNDAQYWNAGYSNGYESKTSGFGIAPVLGIRLKMNKRISLITESSLLLQYSKSTSYRYYLPESSAYPNKANDPQKTNKSFGTTFNYPLSIILTINI